MLTDNSVSTLYRFNIQIMKKLFFFLILIIAFSCGDDDTAQPTGPEDNFDRQAMLINWADNIIVPAYTAFANTTAALKIAGEAFAADPSLANYDAMTTQWEATYIAFQDVSIFEIGLAEELRFTNNLNIYPTDVNGLTENALNGGFNLELPSQIAMQGFPALDYLLYGFGADKAAILDFYQNEGTAPRFAAYAKVLTDRIDDLAQSVLQNWNDSFRNEFVNNSGNSALASVDKLTNDFIFYYEKHLRAGKIGIPAGVFSGDALSENVEAFYRKDFSKTLFNHALDATQDFFNGVPYAGGNEGESMKSYIEYLKVMKNGESLAKVINDQFQEARMSANDLSDNFAEQVIMNNVKMLATYDQLQINVVHLKVDMLQAFNINVDFVDADGD